MRQWWENKMKTFKFSALKKENGKVIYYEACQYRWEETADPERLDEEFFLTKEEAIEYASNLQMEIGFTPMVDEITVDEDVFEIEDAEEEIDIEDYEDYNTKEVETVWAGKIHEGDDISNAIVIKWSWEKYVGYAQNLHEVNYGYMFGFKNEDDLITNQDRTFYPNYSVLLYADEIAGLSDEEINEKVTEALNAPGFKWNHFKNNPLTVEIDF